MTTVHVTIAGAVALSPLPIARAVTGMTPVALVAAAPAQGTLCLLALGAESAMPALFPTVRGITSIITVHFCPFIGSSGGPGLSQLGMNPPRRASADHGYLRSATTLPRRFDATKATRSGVARHHSA